MQDSATGFDQDCGNPDADHLHMAGIPANQRTAKPPRSFTSNSEGVRGARLEPDHATRATFPKEPHSRRRPPILGSKSGGMLHAAPLSIGGSGTCVRVTIPLTPTPGENRRNMLPMDPAVLETTARVITTVLPNAWAIYVYGSSARADDGPASDIDIAVLLPPHSAIPDKLGLMAQIAAAVGRDVDIVDLRRANLDLVHAVLLEGRALLIQNTDETLGWEAERMTDYALFNPRRSDIIEQYMRQPLRRTP